MMYIQDVSKSAEVKFDTRAVERSRSFCKTKRGRTSLQERVLLARPCRLTTPGGGRSCQQTLLSVLIPSERLMRSNRRRSVNAMAASVQYAMKTSPMMRRNTIIIPYHIAMEGGRCPRMDACCTRTAIREVDRWTTPDLLTRSHPHQEPANLRAPHRPSTRCSVPLVETGSQFPLGISIGES